MRNAVNHSLRAWLQPVKQHAPRLFALLKAGGKRLLAVKNALIAAPFDVALWLQKAALCRTPTSNRVLLVRLDNIGDYVLFRNFIESCRTSSRFRTMRLDLLGNVRWKDLSEALDAGTIESFFWIDPASELQRKKAQLELNARRYACIVHSTFSRRAEHDGIVASVAATQKIAPRGDRFNRRENERDLSPRVYTELINTDGPPGRFEFERNKAFFQLLLGTTVSQNQPTIDPTAMGPSDLALPPQYVAFHTDASESEKRWNVEHFASVARFLAEMEMPVVLLGGNDQSTPRFADLVDRIDLVLDLRGRTSLLEAARIVAASEAFVGNDSSLLHIAAATGVKTVIGVCYGKSFGRFAPYPTSDHGRCWFVFPPPIEVNRLNESQLKARYAGGNYEDINLIEPTLVIGRLRYGLTARRRLRAEGY